MFPCTNNIVEYKALVTGIKVVMEWKIIELKFYGDSQLVINQINDDYQMKDDKMISYKHMVEDFKKYFVHITCEQIPRLNNKTTNAMAISTSLLQIPDKQNLYECLVEQLFSPAYDNAKSQVISALNGSHSPLYGKMYAYHKDNTLPPNLSRNQK